MDLTDVSPVETPGICDWTVRVRQVEQSQMTPPDDLLKCSEG